MSQMSRFTGPGAEGRWARRTLVTVLSAAAVAAVVGAPVSASSSTFASQSAGAIIAEARAAMTAEGSVSARGRGPLDEPGAGTVAVSETDYAGPTSGSQSITAGSTRGRPDTPVLSASTLDVDGAVYVSADAAFWSGSAGLTVGQADQAAGRWVQIPSSNALYAPSAADLTMPSLTHDLFDATTYRKGSVRTVDGVRVVPITYVNAGGDGGRTTCDVSLTGKHLPVSVTLGGVPIRLGSWGTTRTVTAPPGAVPLSSLVPSTSSGPV
jgi:hypothetical protein